MTDHRYEAHAAIVPGACGVNKHLIALVTLTLTDAGPVRRHGPTATRRDLPTARRRS